MPNLKERPSIISHAPSILPALLLMLTVSLGCSSTNEQITNTINSAVSSDGIKTDCDEFNKKDTESLQVALGERYSKLRRRTYKAINSDITNNEELYIILEEVERFSSELRPHIRDLRYSLRQQEYSKNCATLKWFQLYLADILYLLDLQKEAIVRQVLSTTN